MAAMAFAVTACSDFDDYNETPNDTTPSGNITLWQNISQNPQLSDFARCYMRVLSDMAFDKLCEKRRVIELLVCRHIESTV